MKLKEAYALAIKTGIANDPRGKKEIERVLKKTKESFEQLKEKEKEFFDTEKLSNPYADTRILFGDPNTEIEEVLVGIDLEVGEVLLADRLNEKGHQINLLLAHHPEGPALAGLSEVMKMQADLWQREGVPINIGDVLIDKRMREVHRNLMPINHNRSVDVARALDLAFMSIHTPADNLVSSFLQKIIDKKDPSTVKEVVEILREVPEYKTAAKEGHGPQTLVGDGEKRAGRVVVDMTGGTEGPVDVIEKLVRAGVGTLVGMHMSDKMRKKAEENHMNVVIAGHIPSDAIGLNLLLDEFEKKGLDRFTTCSGLTRIKRT